jgi:hypothetical protein
MTVGHRALVAFLAMFLVWLLSVAVSMVSSLETRSVTPWIGVFALFTYLFFALPVVSLISVRTQLRFWFLIPLASVVWAVGLLSAFFRQSPVLLLTEQVGSIFGIWAVCYAVISSGLYLLALRYYNRRFAS